MLKQLIADLTQLADADAVADDFIDLGQSAAFEVESGEGECSA
ncbi:MAG TPA: hypothetical protein VFQ65_29645 [Kofleriaceae bacterium]|nr:hypothetical protein [Kofleriaceae bacterium]